MVGGLERTTPESVGIPSEAIVRWLDALERDAPDPHAFTIVRHGAIAAQGWWAPNGPDLRHALYSVSKSFTSTAVGLAVAEGRLGIDDPVVSFFPEDVPAVVSPNLAAMKVRHLLVMSTGHVAGDLPDHLPGYEGSGARAFLALPVSEAPGTRFLYNTPASYMLSAIITKLTGQRLLDYLQPRLFDPLGIDGATWEHDSAGIDMGGFGLRLRIEDLARFGQLYLQEGRWQGRQVVPADWIRAATSVQIATGPELNPNPDWRQGYGFQFWRGRHNSFRADGAFGQYCLVVPDQDLVVAVNSGTEPMHRILDAVWEELLARLSATPLPADPAVAVVLERRLEGLRLRPRIGRTGSSSECAVEDAAEAAAQPSADAAEAAVAGSTYVCDANPLGLASVRFDFDFDGGAVEIRMADGPAPVRLEFGRASWRTGVSSFRPGGPVPWPTGAVPAEPVAASGCWSRPDRFEIDFCIYTNAFRYTFGFEFGGERSDELLIDGRVNAAFGETDFGTVRARRAPMPTRAGGAA